MAMIENFTGGCQAGAKSLSIVAVALATTIIAMTLAAPWARAQDDLAGTYAIEGWDPGQDPAKDAPYHGTGTLERRGEVYFYKGLMDGYNYSGIGICDPERKSFALHFKEAESGRTGVAQYYYSEGTLTGRWAYTDETDGELGREIWTAE